MPVATTHASPDASTDASTAASLRVESIAAALRRAVGTLSVSSDSPRLDAEILLARVLELPRSALIVRAADALSEAACTEFDGLVARRANGCPVAYLTGEREFWSLPLAVTPAVLVPRPETELLVELALALLPTDASRRVLDLGTGSGAIALAIASERPHADITASDVSAEALAVARQNATRLGFSRVHWRLSSWFDALETQPFDLIVANPPYIAADDHALVRLQSEPLSALTPGPTGLEAFTAILDRAALYLSPGGYILLEHGAAQDAAVGNMLQSRGFLDLDSHRDAAGHPRVASAKRPCGASVPLPCIASGARSHPAAPDRARLPPSTHP